MTGDDFDKLCKATGMTKKSIAEYCGVTPRTISNYVKGNTAVPISIIRLLEDRKIK